MAEKDGINKREEGEQEIMPSATLPAQVIRLAPSESFNFSCHPGVTCFTECCRMLELALTPYDVLRLRRATGLSSGQLLEKYIIIEQDVGEPFPRLYQSMVDDGRASCVFVAKEGCTVYAHRPSACRAYPLGRAVMRGDKGTMQEHFVLMREAHCAGFKEPVQRTALNYSLDQELTIYNRFNDAVAVILQHEAIRRGCIPSAKQVELFILALYNLDTFREMLVNGHLDPLACSPSEKNTLGHDDEKLLLFAIDWLQQQLFGIL